MKKFKPTDATTNPSLVLQAASLPQYAHLVDQAISYAKENARSVDIVVLYLWNVACVKLQYTLSTVCLRHSDVCMGIDFNLSATYIHTIQTVEYVCYMYLWLPVRFVSY